MSKFDRDEPEILRSFEKGKLKSVATKAEMAKFKAAACATAAEKAELAPERPKQLSRKRNSA